MTVETVPAGPAIVVANEFFDALPVQHYVRTPRGWCERLVGLDPDGRLAFGLAAEPEAGLTGTAPPGTVLEIGAEARRIIGRLAACIVRDGGGALVVDYGYARPTFGETLQAMRRHAFANVLDSPGEVDITAHVDFSALRRTAVAAGAVGHGPVEQGAFLRALGIVARAARLAERNPGQAPALVAALARLTTPGEDGASGMGTLFKVLALTAPGLPVPPGFEHP